MSIQFTSPTGQTEVVIPSTTETTALTTTQTTTTQTTTTTTTTTPARVSIFTQFES